MKRATFNGTRILRPFRAASGVATTRVQTALGGQPRRIYMGMWCRVYASTTSIPLMSVWDPTTLNTETTLTIDGTGLFRLTITGAAAVTQIGPPADGTWFYIFFYADDTITQATWAQYGRRFQTTILSAGSCSYTDQTQSFGNIWSLSATGPAASFGVDYLFPRFYRISDESIENGGDIRLFAFREMYSPKPTIASLESNCWIDASDRNVYGNVDGASKALWSQTQYDTPAGEVPIGPHKITRLLKPMANYPLVASFPPIPSTMAWIQA